MLRIGIIAVLLSHMFVYSLAEETVGARIFLVSKAVTVIPGRSGESWTIQNITWGKEQERKLSLIAKTDNLSINEWKKGDFSFTPENDGRVKLMIGCHISGKEKPAPREILISCKGVEIKGATLHNPDFDIKDKDGKNPGSWWRNKETVYYQISENDTKMAVGLCVNGICEQWFEVKKGKEVTVTIYLAKGKKTD